MAVIASLTHDFTTATIAEDPTGNFAQAGTVAAFDPRVVRRGDGR